MLTGELRSKIDAIWNAFWAGGIANPIEVIEQITYLLFIRGLDELQTREENKAAMTRKPMGRVIFPAGVYRKDRDGSDVTYDELRWSRLKNAEPARMFTLMADFVFHQHVIARHRGDELGSSLIDLAFKATHRSECRPVRQRLVHDGLRTRHADRGRVLRADRP
ncbi:type I restriction-modification system subunit M N-terminal domain-containing protein [Xanthobacter sp. 91]|uniref:type I restriction-modification system subunit M N-terminal domain-containing protein n=1 Tax=Xanthobacter sp. 91 TaxID=1117244 RepID=UPI00049510E3